MNRDYMMTVLPGDRKAELKGSELVMKGFEVVLDNALTSNMLLLEEMK